MTFEIEKGVPVPSGAVSNRYPFREMEVGDSFFVPSGATQAGNVRAAAAMAGRRHGAKFKVCQKADGVRVWRVS
jgi:hypothetical protein